MIQFPEQRIGREASVEKLWRWWTPKGWSWDVNDKYQSLTIKNGDTLRIPIFFDRHEVKSVDVFQIWLNNIIAVNLTLWQRFISKLKSLVLELFPSAEAPYISSSEGVAPYIYHGYLDLYIDSKWVRRYFVGAQSVPNWGTLVVLNFDESEIMQGDHIIFDLRYCGQRLFVKSLELYAVIVPASR